MGQYHTLYNKTKKEFIEPHNIDNGMKLLEQIGWAGSTSSVLMLLISNSNGRGGGDLNHDNPALNSVIGSWAGDSIVLQGDYVCENDPAYISEEEIATYTDISTAVNVLIKELMAKY